MPESHRNRRQLTYQILDILNRFDDKTDVIREILLAIKKDIGFEAVGIRLSEGEDYPYYVSNGFPKDFIKLENSLCARDESGDLIRDEGGSVVLECMCGNVIKGRTDPSLPFFTEGGSFWSNCTTELLASTTEEDRQARTRNHCNSEGYESVALVPLRSRDTNIGLLQLNDTRRDMFTPDMMEFLEGLGASVGIALARRQSGERSRLYSQQLETTNRELEAFSYSVSHDLRAPLRTINGFSQILLEDYEADLDEQARDHLRRIRSGVHNMATMIEDLLKLSRIARWEMKRERVDLSALAHKITDGLTEAAPERDVHFVIQKNVHVQGDIRLLRVVLENLIGNAWKFTGKQANARIEFGAEQCEDGTAYLVRDDGAGFDMAYAGKLFGAFQRLHSTTEFEGTGVGLATVQRAILRHGGRVWAESEVGKGATIYFTLTEPERAD